MMHGQKNIKLKRQLLHTLLETS